jgi:hypothetical protein
MPSSTEENLNGMCKEIQQLDNSIRFIGIANNLGSLVATAYRNGIFTIFLVYNKTHNEQQTNSLLI